MVEQQGKMSDQTSYVGHIRSIRLLNAIEAKPVPKPQRRSGLIYGKALVNGKKAQAIVDMAAAHNFITLDEVKRVGLQISSESGWLKTVNATTKPLEGVAYSVDL